MTARRPPAASSGALSLGESAMVLHCKVKTVKIFPAEAK